MWTGLKRTLLSLAIAAMAAAPAGAQAPDRYYGHHMMDGWGGMVLGPLMMILTIAAIVVIVVLALRWLGAGGHAGAPGPGKSPLDILKERFARGEIDREEYEQRRQVLER